MKLQPLRANVSPADVSVYVHGPLALFTDPTYRSERVSYDTITPSAADGLLRCLYWKPGFHYEIRTIEVLKPCLKFPLLRNELSGHPQRQIDVGTLSHRAQRSSVVLHDVGYVLHADVVGEDISEQDRLKHVNQARRRVASGSHMYPPYFGMREFTAFFDPPHLAPPCLRASEYLGQQLLRIKWVQDEQGELTMAFHHREDGKYLRYEARARSESHFFDAYLVDGKIHVPEHHYDRMYRDGRPAQRPRPSYRRTGHRNRGHTGAGW